MDCISSSTDCRKAERIEWSCPISPTCRQLQIGPLSHKDRGIISLWVHINGKGRNAWTRELARSMQTAGSALRNCRWPGALGRSSDRQCSRIGTGWAEKRSGQRSRVPEAERNSPHSGSRRRWWLHFRVLNLPRPRSSRRCGDRGGSGGWLGE